MEKQEVRKRVAGWETEYVSYDYFRPEKKVTVVDVVKEEGRGIVSWKMVEEGNGVKKTIWVWNCAVLSALQVGHTYYIQYTGARTSKLRRTYHTFCIDEVID